MDLLLLLLLWTHSSSGLDLQPAEEKSYGSSVVAPVQELHQLIIGEVYTTQPVVYPWYRSGSRHRKFFVDRIPTMSLSVSLSVLQKSSYIGNIFQCSWNIDVFIDWCSNKGEPEFHLSVRQYRSVPPEFLWSFLFRFTFPADVSIANINSLQVLPCCGKKYQQRRLVNNRACIARWADNTNLTNQSQRQINIDTR